MRLPQALIIVGIALGAAFLGAWIALALVVHAAGNQSACHLYDLRVWYDGIPSDYEIYSTHPLPEIHVSTLQQALASVPRIDQYCHP